MTPPESPPESLPADNVPARRRVCERVERLSIVDMLREHTPASEFCDAARELSHAADTDDRACVACECLEVSSSTVECV